MTMDRDETMEVPLAKELPLPLPGDSRVLAYLHVALHEQPRGRLVSEVVAYHFDVPTHYEKYVCDPDCPEELAAFHDDTSHAARFWMRSMLETLGAAGGAPQLQ